MKTLYESILGSTKSGKSHLIDELKNNIKYCANISKFAKLWDDLCLSINKCNWERSIGEYSYNYNHNCIILCVERSDLKNCPCIFIYNDEDKWPDGFNIKEYVNKIAKTLNMSFEYVKTSRYELKFK